MTLDAQNFHTCQTPGLQADVRCHFLVCLRAEHVKLEVLSSWFVAQFGLFGYKRCSYVFVSLKDCCRQLDPLLYSVGNQDRM